MENLWLSKIITAKDVVAYMDGEEHKRLVKNEAMRLQRLENEQEEPRECFVSRPIGAESYQERIYRLTIEKMGEKLARRNNIEKVKTFIEGAINSARKELLLDGV